MAEAVCTVGDVELCYETFGDPADPTLLLVMGLGTQMLAWHEDFCAMLTERGLHVVRFDNRDVGRSTRFDRFAPPTIAQLARRSRRAAGYTLADMAGDAVGLLDHLGVGAAHVAGASMGGMIAQTIAARHPERTASLASIMSTTGSRRHGQPRLATYPILLRAAPREREAYVEHVLRISRVIGSPGLPRDEEALRDLASRAFERGVDSRGSGRQLAAILAAGDRTAELRRIIAPTVVIHGTRDPLIRPSGGRATAKAIPGARLVMIEGMGHDLPRAAWPQIVDAIVENAARADRKFSPPAALTQV